MSLRYALSAFLFLIILSAPPAQAQNESVFGNLCVGVDCTSTETFGQDVLKLKDLNIRIDFNDTSNSSSFPSNDWRITVNSTLNGGPDFFAIDDATNGLRAFMIEDQSQDNALVISDAGGPGEGGGYIGVGTQDPMMEMHLFHGDSPGIRMEQDGTEGFGTYSWDVAANETNFFIRDVTGGDVLPFRIYPEANNGTMTLSTDDRVGIGTTSPTTTLHIEANTPGMRVDNGITGTNIMRLDENGNMTLAGVLTEASSMHLKENRQPVDPGQVLETLKDVPVETWNYTTDTDDIRHMGPMAQSFYAAFGLGVDAEHLAPLDANGVALAAIQGLLDRVEELERAAKKTERRVTEIEKENEELKRRMERLERMVQHHMNQKIDTSGRTDGEN